ncbi:hypothetical protein MRB53_000734 [Persea americana]|uniref:Uncharacterized protein n=1 Tax=Persea americana TaxID=3435 RepID=A0ACC2MPN9_PERAE|nr:hypothetical protein MRB53_000734 [Persea americana]
MAPIRVVGDEFCVPYYTDLVVKKKLKSIFSSTHFQVFDPNGTLVFKVDDGGGFSQHSNRYIRDAGGFPIILMRNKIISWHDRWRVYRGDSHAENNHLFTVKRSHVFQLKTQLDVFLATNTDETRCDFHVKSDFSNHSSKVYRGDSVIAEIDKKSTWGGFFVGKDVFNVRVFPEVDYAFIVSLLIILQEIISSSNDS